MYANSNIKCQMVKMNRETGNRSIPGVVVSCQFALRADRLPRTYHHAMSCGTLGIENGEFTDDDYPTVI